ncbi:MAG TPA: nuclear transport factor 2 family protein [Candidatus Nanoarchaeia archaeon]|nr:nuclear transport factor 2 family protein [Candidatus Nanoarchaeia archaeon]
MQSLKTVVAQKIPEAYERYIGKNMKHHNAYFSGDAESLKKAMEENHAKFPHTTISIKHALEDGDIVAVHSHVKMKPDEMGVAVVHLFRFDKNKIVEMWDVGQPVPKESPNKNGMF